MNVTLRDMGISEELVHYARRCAKDIQESIRGRDSAVVVARLPAVPGRGPSFEVTVRMRVREGDLRIRTRDPDPFLAMRDAFDRLHGRLDLLRSVAAAS